MNNNGFWYDVFHLNNKPKINWWNVLYYLSGITTVVLLILSIVAFTYSAYWYYGIIGLILTLINFRITIVILYRAV